jgi:hypothetical protein
MIDIGAELLGHSHSITLRRRQHRQMLTIGKSYRLSVPKLSSLITH